MSKVRFAVICDRCGTRGEEYGPTISCRECGRDLCDRCAVEYDPEAPRRALCVDCAALPIRGGWIEANGDGQRRWDFTSPFFTIEIPAAGLASGKLRIRPHRSECGVIKDGVGISTRDDGIGFVVRLEDLEWALNQVRKFRADEELSR